MCRAVEHVVEWGLAHRDLSGVTALGIDEIAWARGHTYSTLVYDIGGETKRLLTVAEDRSVASLRCCLDSLGQLVCLEVKYVCSDMWRPYLNVIAEKLGHAVHVLDRSMSCKCSANHWTKSERTRRSVWCVTATSRS